MIDTVATLSTRSPLAKEKSHQSTKSMKSMISLLSISSSAFYRDSARHTHMATTSLVQLSMARVNSVMALESTFLDHPV